MRSITSMPELRFRVLTMSRHPVAVAFATEVAWYSDDQEHVIGAVLLDHTDGDWNTVVLGRDRAGLFRWIDGETCMSTREEAEIALQRKIAEHVSSGQEVFPQGEIDAKKNEIFEAVIPEDRLHPFFRSLRDHVGHSPAKEIIKEIAYAFVDLDGNFTEQFQTTGFNARLWELYLFAYLYEDLFLIADESAYPDYQCGKMGQTLFVECTTVNPSSKYDIDWTPKNKEQFRMLNEDYFPIRFGSALYSKLQRKYWTLDHVKESPLIFAIHDFHQADSMTWSSTAIGDYLFGYRYCPLFDAEGNLSAVPVRIESHEWQGKKIPSGFFFQPDTENVSAVLFSNSGTISKFNRMGKLAAFGAPNIRMIRAGALYNPDPNATEPIPFVVEIDQKGYAETWGQGLSMYHNPNALRPVNPELFPGIAHHWLDEENVTRSVFRGPHPMNSKTLVFAPTT